MKLESTIECIPSVAVDIAGIFGAMRAQLPADSTILRLALVGRAPDGSLLCEVSRIAGGTAARPAPVLKPSPLKQGYPRGTVVCLVVPTGVGATIGGFIGDSGPIARVLEEVADLVIVHPNVVNGSDLYGAGSSWYADGYTLDQFFQGEVRLSARFPRRIGLIIDRLAERDHARLINAANGMRAVQGVRLNSFCILRERLRASVRASGIGHFIGSVENPEVLLEAADILLRDGCDAIAVATDVGGIDSAIWREHYAGVGVNPVGAIEAMISRAITWWTGVPCAHAPAVLPELDQEADPRAAAEPAAGTGLPCVLQGLSRAPRAVPHDASESIGIEDVSEIVMPASCAGGVPSYAGQVFGAPMLFVRENATSVGLPATHISLPVSTIVDSYVEAIANIASKRAGVSWESIRRPLAAMKRVGP